MKITVTNKLKDIVFEHFKKYPKAELQDFLKMLYQNEFGPKHLCENEIEAFKALSKEFQAIEYAQDEDLFEDIGYNAVRMNLKALPKDVNLNYINKIVISSANHFKGTNENLVIKFGLLVVMAENNEIPFPIEQVRDETNGFARNGFKPISHSAIYNEIYSPSYRVIVKSLVPLVEAIIALSKVNTEKEHFIISIDGSSASGKTTLANNLATLLNGEVVHCDDFFLPPELRTEARLNEIGGNIHYERLKSDVIDNLGKKKAISYKAFDCSTCTLKNTRFLMNKKFIIVEGAYSSHPYFESYADFKIFMKIQKEKQEMRILVRNGDELLKRFINEWIPKENAYFEKFKIEENADLIIRSV